MFYKMKKLLSLLLAVTPCVAVAQHTYRAYLKDNTAYREHVLDITHMKLEVRFDPAKGLVKGKVTHTFTVLQKNVDSIFFDAPGIDIRSAKINGSNLPYKTNSYGVWVKPQRLHWDETGTIVFEYEASPRKGIYFIGWNAPENKANNPFAVRKQIWTQGQGVDNRYWIPMYDDMNDKFITETIVTFDKGYEVLSNGLLQDKKDNGDTYTWHYAMSKPHAGYLLMLGIGKYDIRKTKSKSGVPMNLYYYPEFADRAEPTYQYSERMVDFLEKETGYAYPWESYSQIMVQDFMYGAMENTTATIFGDFFNVDRRAYRDRNYVGVNCHELTHQWFGDCITARDNRDTWLQESYATYFPKMFTRSLLGEDEYDWMRRSEQNTALDASKKDRNPIRYAQAGTARVYQKGSSVISMLSYVLGEDQWKRALNHYLTKHAYANVETNDLQQAIQDKLGMDMSWFFEQWLYHGGEPEYTVSYSESVRKGEAVTEISVQQTQQRNEVVGLFKMPFVFEVHYTDGTKDRVKEWIAEASELVQVPNRAYRQIAFVLFDPGSNVLKSVVFKKSFKELCAQALHAPEMLDRYDALLALKSYPADKKQQVLMQVFRHETFHQLKAEIVSQLIELPSLTEELSTVFAAEAPSAKLAAIKGSADLSAAWKKVFIKALQDSSYEVVQAGLEKLCKTYPSESDRFLQATREVYGMNNSVNIKWHELAATYTADKQSSQDQLVDYASAKWEFRTRGHAFNALKNLGYCDEQLIVHLFDALLSTNGRLAAPAAQLAEFLAQQTIYKNMMSTYFKSRKWAAREKTQLKSSLNFL
jgi:aminopeptidase N